MIVACYHPLPLCACMLNFDLVSILFGTSIPRFYILQHFSENVFTLVSLVFTMCSNVYKRTGFRSTSLAHTYEDSQQLLAVSRSKKRTQRSNAGSQTARQTTTTTKLLTSRLQHVSKQANGV